MEEVAIRPLKLRGISRLSRIVAAAALILLGMPLAAAGPGFAGPPEAQNGRGQGNGGPRNVVEVKPGEIVPGQHIVVLHDDVVNPGAVANELARAHGLGLGFTYSHALKGFSATVPEGALQALSRDPRVDYIEADQTVRAFAQSLPTGVDRIFADDNPNITIDGNDDWRIDVDVAVIDTGVDVDHPDLNVFARTDCTGNPFNTSCADDAGDDGNGHGTHVAGTIGAIDNVIGVVGVAPGARLWAVKVLKDNGNGWMSNVIAGVDWVTSYAAKIEVANMSLGGGNSSALCQAIGNSVWAGVVYAVAAGNSDDDAGKYSPANCADVITVSALADFDGAPGGLGSPTCRTDEDDTGASFSNWGGTIEVAAPGVCILSTWNDGGTNTISGTSMASPHVAGAAALLASGANDPTSKADVDAIIATIINAGNFIWFDDSGDGIKEPLLDVSSVAFSPATVVGSGGGGGTTDTAPSASIDNPADGAIVSGVVTIQIAASDAEDSPGTLDVSWRLDGGSWQVASYNSTSGYYEESWNTAGSEGTSGHVIEASVTDSFDNTTTDSNSNISVADPTSEATTAHVEDAIGCSFYGGKLRNKHLDIEVTVADNLLNPVAGATVSVEITLDDGPFWSPTATTASDGTVVFAVKGADPGTYETTVTNVDAAPLTWDEIQPTGNTCIQN